jgi:hypothetical protein
MSVADIAAVVAALASISAAVIGTRLVTKVQQVHVLVNSQLADVMTRLAAMTAERDKLADDKAPDA